MKRVLTYIKHINRTQIVWGIVLVAVLAGGWFFFFRSAPVKQQTAVLAPKAFLQQVSVSGKVVAAKQVDLGFSQSGRRNWRAHNRRSTATSKRSSTSSKTPTAPPTRRCTIRSTSLSAMHAAPPL